MSPSYIRCPVNSKICPNNDMRTPTEQEIEFVLDFVLFPIAYFKSLVVRKLRYYNINSQSICWHLWASNRNHAFWYIRVYHKRNQYDSVNAQVRDGEKESEIYAITNLTIKWGLVFLFFFSNDVKGITWRLRGLMQHEPKFI